MDRNVILQTLADLRNIQMACWGEYHEMAVTDPFVWSNMRDLYEMNVRVLDYVRTMIGKEENA